MKFGTREVFRRFIVTGTAALASVACIQAHAQPVDGERPAPRGPGQLLERFDDNQDGKLAEDELPAPLWQRLSRLDADDDHAIDAGEFAQMRDRRRARGPEDRPGERRRRGGRRGEARPFGPPSDHSAERPQDEQMEASENEYGRQHRDRRDEGRRRRAADHRHREVRHRDRHDRAHDGDGPHRGRGAEGFERHRRHRSGGPWSRGARFHDGATVVVVYVIPASHAPHHFRPHRWAGFAREFESRGPHSRGGPRHGAFRHRAGRDGSDSDRPARRHADRKKSNHHEPHGQPSHHEKDKDVDRDHATASDVPTVERFAEEGSVHAPEEDFFHATGDEAAERPSESTEPGPAVDVVYTIP